MRGKTLRSLERRGNRKRCKVLRDGELDEHPRTWILIRFESSSNLVPSLFLMTEILSGQHRVIDFRDQRHEMTQLLP